MEDIATAIVLVLIIIIVVLIDTFYAKYINKELKDDYDKSEYLKSKEWKKKARKFKEDCTK